MLLSNKIQKIALTGFFIGILLSVTYMILILSGVSIPEELKKWAVLSAGLLVCISALIAPFTREKEETDFTKAFRKKLVVTMAAIYFCFLLCCHAVKIILQVNGVENVQFFNEITGLKSVLLLEIIYFILLKYRLRS